MVPILFWFVSVLFYIYIHSASCRWFFIDLFRTTSKKEQTFTTFWVEFFFFSFLMSFISTFFLFFSVTIRRQRSPLLLIWRLRLIDSSKESCKLYLSYNSFRLFFLSDWVSQEKWFKGRKRRSLYKYPI
jgi:hypothetical protein